MSVLKVTLETLGEWSELRPSISHFVRRYQEERGDKFTLELSTDVFKHLVKLHRALRFTRLALDFLYDAHSVTGHI